MHDWSRIKTGCISHVGFEALCNLAPCCLFRGVCGSAGGVFKSKCLEASVRSHLRVEDPRLLEH